MTMQRILRDGAPELLTDKDIKTVEVQAEVELLYSDELETPLDIELASKQKQELQLDQVNDRIFRILNPEDAVCSTVDAPVLDETNLLYKVDGVNDGDLFKVLELHRHATGHTKEADLTDDSKTFDLGKVSFKGWLNNFIDASNKHRVIESRAQRGTEQHNQIMGVDYDGEVEIDDTGLQDINPDYKQAQLYRKEQKVLTTARYLLDKAWKSYRKRERLREKTINKEWIRYNSNMMEEFKSIKRYQGYIEKIEKVNYDSRMKTLLSSWQRNYDDYLARFVDYQQKCIAEGKECTREWEDVVAKVQELKPLTIKPFVPSWKQVA